MRSKTIGIGAVEIEILKTLINGKALAVSKTETKAYLVFEDYSFYKNIQHWQFDKLKKAGLLTKIDSRVTSIFYSISQSGIDLLTTSKE